MSFHVRVPFEGDVPRKIERCTGLFQGEKTPEEKDFFLMAPPPLLRTQR